MLSLVQGIAPCFVPWGGCFTGSSLIKKLFFYMGWHIIFIMAISLSFIENFSIITTFLPKVSSFKHTYMLARKQ